MEVVSRSAWWKPRLWQVLSALGCAAGVLASPTSAEAQQAASAVYVRIDSDDSVIVTPRVSVRAPLSDETRIDAAYSMDVWSSASVDIVTSASAAVTERRDEINASITHDFSDASLSAGYRYSYEPDYISHAPSLGLRFDFANKASTLDIGGGVSFDDVGRAGDPGYDRSLVSYNAQLAFTQVLDASTLLQGVYSFGYSDGFLSSPYRYVGVGSWNGACGGFLETAPVRVGVGALEYCLPEQNPDERMRHAFVLRGSRALGEDWSLGAAYRFYLDDWELMSHTVLADLNWLPDTDTMLALRYRFYLQSAAAHYRSRFPSIGSLRDVFSRDKELSPFNSHRVMLEFERNWSLSGPGEVFRTVLSIGPTLYLYSNFIPYQRLFAVEATISGVLVL